MKRRFFLILLTLFLLACTGPQVCFEGTCFDVEVADTQEERTKGLADRHYIAPDGGMIFVFEREGGYKFWMKNTTVVIDMIWLDKNYEVVHITEVAQPCNSEQCPHYQSTKGAMYVVELKGDTARKLGLEVGDTMDVKI